MNVTPAGPPTRYFAITSVPTSVTGTVAVAVCAAGYLLSGERRYLGWAVRVIKYAGAAALIFFAILLLERIA